MEKSDKKGWMLECLNLIEKNAKEKGLIQGSKELKEYIDNEMRIYDGLYDEWIKDSD